MDAASAAPLPGIEPVPGSLPPGWAGNTRHAFSAIGSAVVDAIEWLTRAFPIVLDAWRAVRQYGLMNVIGAAQRIVASLNRYPLLRFLNQLTHNQMPPLQSPYSSVALDTCALPRPLEPGDEVAAADQQLPATFREDVVTQNQLTLVTVVRPGQAVRVRAVMAAIDSYSMRLSPPGSLIGISTIHFVKWLLIDNGRRLMMVSDYDGSWESYIDEFAEMILSGLDAIWETSYGFPARWRARPAGLQALPAQPPGSLRGVLQCLPGPDGAERRQRSCARRVRATTSRPALCPVCCVGSDHGDHNHTPARRCARRRAGLHHQRLRAPVACRVSLRRVSGSAAGAALGGKCLAGRHDRERMADAADWREDQAGVGREHCLHRLRTRARLASPRECGARSRWSFGRGSRRNTDREFSATPKRATRQSGNWAARRSRRSMPSC